MRAKWKKTLEIQRKALKTSHAILQNCFSSAIPCEFGEGGVAAVQGSGTAMV